MVMLATALIILGLSSLSLAQDSNAFDSKNYFLNPPPAGPKLIDFPPVYQYNPAYIIGKDLRIAWTTDASTVNIMLFQEGGDHIPIEGKPSPMLTRLRIVQ